MPGPAAAASDGLDLDLDSYVQTQQVLLAAAHHDLESLSAILKTAPATVQDTDTGYTALHAAIASCASETLEAGDGRDDDAPTSDAEAKTQQQSDGVTRAEQTLRLLLQNGAIWNDLDFNNETPGCMARRLELKTLYEIMVDAGVRAELLLNRLDKYEPISEDEEDDEDDEVETAMGLDSHAVRSNGASEDTGTEPQVVIEQSEVEKDASTQSSNYLSSALTFTGDRILDSAANGVMMAWETSLMQRTAAALAPKENLRILNVGFGMGIFDSFIQDEHRPAKHHIVEAHPDVLKNMKETGWDSTCAGYTKRNVTVHPGTWQEVLPRLVEEGLQFDAIFFDTFAEGYSSFRDFFSEYVIALLTPNGRWSFFHGLGADRQVCYDVYTKVVEMDIFEAGFDVEWEEIALPNFQQEAQQEQDPWHGVRRKYFDVGLYRLPICKFVE